MLDVALFLYQVFVLVGASAAAGNMVNRVFFRGQIPAAYKFLAGFGTLPVLIVFAGFSGLGSVRILMILTGIACALYGLWKTYGLWKQRQHIINSWRVLVLPGLMVLLMFVCRFWFLFGTIGGEEVRLTYMINAFASYGLKQVYPFDASIPVYYSHFFPDIGAFLYSAVNGIPFPSNTQLVVILFAVALAYRALYLLCTHVFKTSTSAYFIFLSLLLPLAGIRGVLLQLWDAFPGLALLTAPLSASAMKFFMEDYHYLFGICIGLLGLTVLQVGLSKKEHLGVRLSVLFFAVCLGFAGISFAWFLPAIALLFALFLFQERMAAVWFLLREILPSGALLLYVLVSLWTALLPGLPLFGFYYPHFWFPRDEIKLSSGIGPASLFNTIAFDIATIAQATGIFLTVGFFGSIVLFGKRMKTWWSERSLNDPLLGISALVVGGMFLLTFTLAFERNWISRGFFPLTIASAILAAAIFLPHIWPLRLRILPVLLVGILCLQAVSAFLLGNVHMYDRVPLSPLTLAAHAQPLGTVFHASDLHTHSYKVYLPDGSDMDVISAQPGVLESLMLAGRAIVGVPQEIYLFYLHDFEVLRRIFSIEIVEQFVPCKRTLFGSNTPTGDFYIIENNQIGQWFGCPEEQ